MLGEVLPSPREDGAVILELEQVTKRYAGRRALEGCSLRVRQGEVVAVMGPSGCGKSTALRCMMGLCQPDHGRVRAFGQDLWALDEPARRGLRQRMAMVFQRPQLMRRWSVLDNVAAGLVMRGTPVAAARDAARRYLAMVAMEDLASARPADLSGGEGQRVAIARALALEPEVLMWDEPTSSLDPMRVAELLSLIEELMRRLRVTMVIVTHEVRFARRVARRLVYMDGGRVVEEGPPAQLLRGECHSPVGRCYAALAAV